IGDEAGVVLAAQLFVDFAVWSIGGADGFNGFGGHVGCLRLIQETTATSMRRRSVSGKGRSICARVTPRSASASTSLIRRQLERTPHCSAMPHWLSSWLHSVIASGPSIASTISNRVISLAWRVSR